MPAQPDLIVWGSHLRTLDPSLPFCSALAVKDDLFATSSQDVVRGWLAEVRQPWR